MHNRRKQSRRPKREGNQSEQRMVTMLERMVLLNEAQTNRMIPGTQDIPRLKLNRNRVYTASFSYLNPNTTSNSTAESTGALFFQLSNVLGYTSWTGAFDSYRIVAAYVEFIPFGITASSNATLGQITTVIDYDDAALANRDLLLQYDTCQIVDVGKYFERRLVPRAAKAMYSGTFTSYGQDTMPWLDCDSPNVQHYGIKYSTTVSSSAQTGYTPMATLVVNFRNND